MTERVTVLVVDDDPDQLESLRRGLFLAGYQSLGAEDAEQALAVIESELGASVALVITDYTLPGGSGGELVARLHRLRPELPVIVITGLNMSRQLDQLRRGGVLVLQKPLKPTLLEAAIRCQLGAAHG